VRPIVANSDQYDKRRAMDTNGVIVCDRCAVTSDLVPTGVAAKAIGVDRATLVRWWQAGTVEPVLVTPGGHARWDIADLKRQLRDLRDR
jgi:hypothetical protein